MFSFTESESKSVAHLAVTLTDITVMKNPKWPPPRNFFSSLHSQMSEKLEINIFFFGF